MVKPKAREHYVDNKKLYAELTDHINAYNKAKEEGVQTPPINRYIGSCIQLIANRYATKKNFSGYSFIEDMKGDGIENCIRYLHNFDPVKYSNPLAYFTQIIYFAFLQRIENEKKQSYIKYKATENSLVMNTLVEMASDDQSHFHAVINDMDYEKLSNLAHRFERVKTEKLVKKKGVEVFIDDETVTLDDEPDA